jgi:hypothetical protein
MTPDLLDLEPAKVPQRGSGSFDRQIDRLADALFRGTNEFYDFVDMFGHGRSP